MTNFALITEGITDQIIIENILKGYFYTNKDDMDFNPLQPSRDNTDTNYGNWLDGYCVSSKFRGPLQPFRGPLQPSSTNYGNWLNVFEYCGSSNFRGACQYDGYIIIQIDTDISEEKHYDVLKYENGVELTPEELIKKVISKFKEIIGTEVYEKYQDKIIFAISVHSIECWLLPLYYDDNRKAKLPNCDNTVDEKLKKSKSKIRLKNKQGKKNVDSYREISKEYCKHKILMKLYPENPSLKIFIEEVEKKNIIIEDEDDF